MNSVVLPSSLALSVRPRTPSLVVPRTDASSLLARSNEATVFTASATTPAAALKETYPAASPATCLVSPLMDDFIFLNELEAELPAFIVPVRAFRSASAFFVSALNDRSSP